MMTQELVMEQLQDLMDKDNETMNPIYRNKIESLLLDNKNIIKCDGCGHRFTEILCHSTLHANHPKNPYNRRVILHLVNEKHCNIRVCANCGEKRHHPSKISCSKCKKPIERQIMISIYEK